MAVFHPSALFNDIVEFLISAPSYQQIIDFTPPEQLQTRLSFLLEQNRQGQISPDEQEELNEFLQINRLMSRLKLKARQKLSE